jgi:hypothetical protein
MRKNMGTTSSEAPRVALLARVGIMDLRRTPTFIAGEAYLQVQERLYLPRYLESRAVLEDRHLMFLLSRYVATTKYDALTKTRFLLVASGP